jgi:phosphoribosyl 1,2-cyclic phosphodiesterase
MVRFASLGSGSRGNALIVEAGATRIMLDCGFSFAETCARLGRLGLEPHHIDAVIVTHEHDDHMCGAAQFVIQMQIPVYMTSGTRAATGRKFKRAHCICFDPHAPFQIRDLLIHPFPVPHDAREPAQCVFDDGAVRLGVLTDVGTPTPHIRHMLSGCAALVLECNYDEELLRTGPYPPTLKARIGSRYGHLQNGDSARLLASLDVSRLQHIVAAHLSETNNTPQLARSALADALRAHADEIHVATQSDGMPWFELR